MSRKTIAPQEIDALLPQTQCGLCGFGGCMPYAKAMAEQNAPINLCPPGGVTTLIALGNLLAEDPTPFVPAMEKQQKPLARAIIRENECIGCTKCIQACPVDAILGASKFMHTVIADECTGCELCVSPCPVDCIDIIPLREHEAGFSPDLARKRFNSREMRLQKKRVSAGLEKNQVDRKGYIQQALARVKQKKSEPRL